MVSENTAKILLAALKPFAEIGSIFCKQGDRDDSPWVEIPDDQYIRIGGSMGWNVKVGELRAAARAFEAGGGEYD